MLNDNVLTAAGKEAPPITFLLKEEKLTDFLIWETKGS